MEVSLIAHLEAKEGLGDQLAERLLQHTAAVRGEPGNRLFQVYRHREAPNRFEVVETYADRAAFEGHIAAPHSVAFNAWLAGIAVGGGSSLTFLDAL